jgi:hypothetical protein
MSDLQDAVIQGHLRTLKLPGIRAEFTQIARQAREDSWSYEEYLRELLDTERSAPGNTGPLREDSEKPGFQISRPWIRLIGRPWRG